MISTVEKKGNTLKKTSAIDRSEKKYRYITTKIKNSIKTKIKQTYPSSSMNKRLIVTAKRKRGYYYEKKKKKIYRFAID